MRKTFNSAVPSFIFVVFVMFNTSTGDAQLITDMARGSASILETKIQFVEDDENTYQSGTALDTLLITEMENGSMQARVKIASPFNRSKIVTSHGVGARTSNNRLLAVDSNDVRCANTRLEMPSCTSCMVGLAGDECAIEDQEALEIRKFYFDLAGTKGKPETFTYLCRRTAY